MGNLLEAYLQNGCEKKCGEQQRAWQWFLEPAYGPGAPQLVQNDPMNWVMIAAGGAILVGGGILLCIAFCPEIAAGGAVAEGGAALAAAA